MKLNEAGLAEYNTIVGNNTPGKHSMPVKIAFTTPEGVVRVIQKNVEYEIAP